jgi:hypothetical protein
MHSIYNCSYGWDELQKHSVKTKVDWFRWLTKIPHTQKHNGLDDSQKHSENTKAQWFG